MVCDLDGRVAMWSDGAEALYGWRAAGVIGRLSHEVLQTSFPMPPDEIRSVLFQQGRWHGQLRQRHCDGTRMSVVSHWVLYRQPGRVPLVIEVNHDVTRLAQAQHSQRYLAAIVESSENPIIGETLDGQVTSWNRAAETVLGWTAEQIVGQSITRVVPPHLLEHDAALRARVRAGGPAQHLQTVRLHRSGEEVPVSLTISPIHDEPGAVIGASMILRDITAQLRADDALRRAHDTLEQRVAERTRELADQMEARRAAETALARSQKLEAVGQLTGGVAHDFNNLLTVIAGNLHFIGRSGRDNPRLQRLAASTLRAVERGARLTARLLAFARRQTLQPEVLRLDQVVCDFAGLVVRALGESVRLQITADDDVWPTEVDPAQFEAAVLNLTLNARDAMPAGGRLSISTRNVIDPDVPELPPGRYVCITVGDSGEGMTPEVASRAIEPFFTTKEVGRGSGLGLSQVYGFARQSGGGLTIDSQPACGTRVSLYFPATSVPQAPRLPEWRGAARRRPARRTTVLVVEDDPELLDLVQETLREDGHAVICASDGQAALAALDRHPEVDALVSDVVMPNGVSGVTLGQTARRLRPQIGVLLMSGYPRDELNRSGGTAGFAFLPKPFRPAELAERVQGVLAAD